MATTIVSTSTPALKAFTTNSTAASFTQPVSTLTEPTADGVVDLAKDGLVTNNQIKLLPFGVGSATQTFNLRVVGWTTVRNATVTQWVPFTLCELVCTLCTATGVATAPVTDTNKFCDTITLTTGNANVDNSIVSPGSNQIAHAVIDVKGCAKIQVLIDVVSATSGNALVGGL